MSESNENQSGCGCIFSIIALIAGLAKIVISFSKLGGGSGAIIGIFVAIAIAIIFFAIEASKEKTNLDDDDDDPTGYAAREKREKAKRKMQEIQNSIEKSNTKQEGSDTVTYGLNEVVNNEIIPSSTEDKEEYDDEESEDKELVEKFKKLIDCPCRFYGTDSSDELLKDYNESLKPKTVIRISRCCMAERNPLVFPISKGRNVVFSTTWPSTECACSLSFPDMRVLISVRSGLS